MLYIQKENCPADLQADIDRLTGGSRWASFAEVPSTGEAHAIRKNYFDKLNKSRVREALIAEQHGLCAYCMCRIKNSGNSTTIEHFVPLSRSKAGAMNYQNWLAVCKGGQNIKKPEGEKRIICCDAKKSNTIATLTPLDRDHMAHIAYYDDGTIYFSAVSHPDYLRFCQDLNSTYGLNGKMDPKTNRSQKDTTSGIVKQRKDTYNALFDELMRLESAGDLTAELLTRYRRSLLSDPEWEPFLGVKLYVLDMFLEILNPSAT